MKKRMKIFGVMMLVCMTMNCFAEITDSNEEKAMVKEVVYTTNFHALRRNCMKGFGLCFLFRIQYIESGLPISDDYVAIRAGVNDDMSKLFLIVSEDGLHRYDNGRYLSEFKDQREVCFDEALYFDRSILNDLGIDSKHQFSSHYPVKEENGLFIMEIDLK